MTVTALRADGRTAQAERTASRGRGWIRRLLGYCRRYPVVSVLALIGSASLALNSLTPLLTKTVIDDISSGLGDQTTWAIIGLVAVGVGLFGTSFLRRWTAGRLSLQVQHDLRQDVFGAIQRLDGPGQDQLRTGQVVSRANSDLQMVQALMQVIPMSGGQLVNFVVSLALMLVLSPWLTLTALVVVPATVYLAQRIRTTIFPATCAGGTFACLASRNATLDWKSEMSVRSLYRTASGTPASPHRSRAADTRSPTRPRMALERLRTGVAIISCMGKPM